MKGIVNFRFALRGCAIATILSLSSQVKSQDNSEPCEGAAHALARLDSLMPELRVEDAYLRKVSKNNVKLVMWVESCPDSAAKAKIERQYYTFYIGEDHAANTVRNFTLLLNKDDRSILVYDTVHDTYTPLDRVRKTKAWRAEWNRKKRLLKAK